MFYNLLYIFKEYFTYLTNIIDLNMDYDKFYCEQSFLSFKTFFTSFANIYNWKLNQFDTNKIILKKIGDETSSVDISINQDVIIVSVPIKNSPYQYVKTFKGNEFCKAGYFAGEKMKDYSQ